MTAIYVITHIDIIPTHLEAGRKLLLRCAADLRDEPGLTRFELLNQLDRPNYFETLAIWDSQAHYVDSLGARITLSYRKRLQPFLGSPFDDRILTLVDELPHSGRVV